MKYGVMLAAGSLLLAGCADVARQSDMEKLSAELAALQKDFAGVNAKLDKLLKDSGGHSGIVSRRANPFRKSRPIRRSSRMWMRFMLLQKARIHSAPPIRKWRCSERSVRDT